MCSFRVHTRRVGHGRGGVHRPSQHPESQTPGACPADPRTSLTRRPPLPSLHSPALWARRWPPSQPWTLNGLCPPHPSSCPSSAAHTPSPLLLPGGCKLPWGSDTPVVSARPPRVPGCWGPATALTSQLFPGVSCRLAPPCGHLGHHLPPSPPLCGQERGGSLPGEGSSRQLGVRGSLQGSPWRDIWALWRGSGPAAIGLKGPISRTLGLEAGFAVLPGSPTWAVSGWCLPGCGQQLRSECQRCARRPQTPRKEQGPSRGSLRQDPRAPLGSACPPACHPGSCPDATPQGPFPITPI